MDTQGYQDVIQKISEKFESLNPPMEAFLKQNYETQGLTDLELAMYFQIQANVYTKKVLMDYGGFSSEDLLQKSMDILKTDKLKTLPVSEFVIESTNLAYLSLGALHAIIVEGENE